MSQQKITVTGTTNFGLALVLRYFNRKKPVVEWDFSAMKAMLNGAEPISVRIMEDFVDTLRPFGFRPEAMMPVYGMAEATLAISFTPLMQPSVITAFNASLLDRENKALPLDPSDPGARLFSGVGVALNDVDIRILDEEGEAVPEGIAGRIQLKAEFRRRHVDNLYRFCRNFRPGAIAAYHGYLVTLNTLCHVFFSFIYCLNHGFLRR